MKKRWVITVAIPALCSLGGCTQTEAAEPVKQAMVQADQMPETVHKTEEKTVANLYASTVSDTNSARIEDLHLANSGSPFGLESPAISQNQIYFSCVDAFETDDSAIFAVKIQITNLSPAAYQAQKDDFKLICEDQELDPIENVADFGDLAFTDQVIGPNETIQGYIYYEKGDMVPQMLRQYSAGQLFSEYLVE